MPLQDVLRDLASYLEYQLDEGSTTLEMDGVEAAVVRSVAAGSQVRPPSSPKAMASASIVEPAKAAPRPSAEMGRLVAEVAACTRCPLHKGRTLTVPGQGNPAPEVLFVGEGPGEDEDRQGLAFVGRAGQLLTKMIEAMGYRREEVFIANIVKCRPPDNRKPLPEEMATCLPYLRRQIAELKPKVIVALGATAMEGLMNLTGITRLRGQWMTYEGIDLMPTYHPSYLLRTPSAKREVWEDLKAVLARLGRTPPPVPPKSQG